MSVQDFVSELQPWERSALALASRNFEARREIDPPLVIDDWHFIIAAEANLICGVVTPRGQGSRIVTVVIVGADPDRGRLYTIVGWLELGASANPPRDIQSELDLLEREAVELRDVLLGRA